MLTLVTDQKKINALYREFCQRLAELFPTKRPDVTIGHHGGATNSVVHTTSSGDFWTCASDIAWNPFGIGNTWSMVVQVNFSSPNAKRRAIGVFAEDDDGQPVVLHRGNIGGGRPGIGKTLLMNHTDSPRESVFDGTKEVKMLVVGVLRSPLFAAQLKHFVLEVHRVKEGKENGDLAGLPSTLFDIEGGVFKSEASGHTVLPALQRRELQRSHGLLVSALRGHLARHFRAAGWQTYNDRHRDIILRHQERVVALFEIKTAATTQDVATALGQLFLYGAANEPVRRIMVLPEPLTSEAERHLLRWGIECLYFSGRADNPRFSKLAPLLKSVMLG